MERLSRREFIQFWLLTGGGLFLRNLHKESETSLNERVAEIMALVEPLGFDAEGNLCQLKAGKNGPDCRLSLIPTHFNEVRREPMEAVKLLVVHYDAGERYRENGVERTALNTVNGLNGNDPDGNGIGPSVHWCIDNFPIQRNETGAGGFGILQTQEASGDPFLPFAGLHVSTAPSDVDPNRTRTRDRFVGLRIDSNLNGLVADDDRDFNLVSLGYEQVGTYFEERFPSDVEPPRRQLANAVSLCLAVMTEFHLSPWDIIGHHELQQKSDPGDYHLATLRFLLGVAAIQGKIRPQLVFGNESARIYFDKVADYLVLVDRYGRFNAWKQFVGFDAFVDSLD
jgi:hypothetical protein